VYLIARNIFGKGAALVASLIFILVLYGLTLQYLNYMTAFWLMQPLVLFVNIQEESRAQKKYIIQKVAKNFYGIKSEILKN